MDAEKPRRPMLLDCLSPNCGATLISAVAQVLAEGLNPSQLNVLGAFLASVGDTLTYMASQAQFNSEFCTKIPAKAAEDSADSTQTESKKNTDGKSGDKDSESKDANGESNSNARKPTPKQHWRKAT